MSFALKATSTNVSVNSLGVVSRRCTHLHMLHISANIDGRRLKLLQSVMPDQEPLSHSRAMHASQRFLYHTNHHASYPIDPA